MNILLASLFAAAAVIAGALIFAPNAEITTQVDIDASPSKVWEVLADVSSHKHWNPFLVNMEGNMVEGARLTNTMRPGGADREMTFRPIVLKAIPGRELRWLGRLFVPRIFDGEHYFMLQEHQGGTRLLHGERFSGIGLWFIDVRQFRSDFEAMNAALKATVEAQT